jgi:hypothetical protein
MVWWRRYYKSVFPEGKATAFRQFERTVMLLSENPLAGRAVEVFKLRQFPILNTPFSLIYRIRGDRLEIVRVWDMRQKPSHGFQEDE